MKIDGLKMKPVVDIRDIRVFRAENFPISQQVPWLDRPDWREQVTVLHQKGELTDAQAALCTQWAEHGYVIVPRMFSEDVLNRVWKQYEERIGSGVLKSMDGYGSDSGIDPLGRVLNPHFHVPEFDALLRDSAAVDLVSLLLGVKALPFQTIAGHKGESAAQPFRFNSHDHLSARVFGCELDSIRRHCAGFGTPRILSG